LLHPAKSEEPKIPPPQNNQQPNKPKKFIIKKSVQGEKRRVLMLDSTKRYG